MNVPEYLNKLANVLKKAGWFGHDPAGSEKRHADRIIQLCNEGKWREAVKAYATCGNSMVGTKINQKSPRIYKALMDMYERGQRNAASPNDKGEGHDGKDYCDGCDRLRVNCVCD